MPPSIRLKNRERSKRAGGGSALSLAMRYNVTMPQVSTSALPMNQTDPSQPDAPRYFRAKGAKSETAAAIAAIAHRIAL